MTSSSKIIPPSIYFGGCCFGAAFYVGVHKAMVEKWGKDFYKHCVVGGGSAGTIFAVGLALGKSPEYMDKLYLRVAEQAKKYGPIYYASVFMREGLEEMFKDDSMAYKKLEGRCCFGTTSFFSRHRWHLSWESNDDLLGSFGSFGSFCFLSLCLVVSLVYFLLCVGVISRVVGSFQGVTFPLSSVPYSLLPFTLYYPFFSFF